MQDVLDRDRHARERRGRRAARQGARRAGGRARGRARRASARKASIAGSTAAMRSRWARTTSSARDLAAAPRGRGSPAAVRLDEAAHPARTRGTRNSPSAGSGAGPRACSRPRPSRGSSSRSASSPRRDGSWAARPRCRGPGATRPRRGSPRAGGRSACAPRRVSESRARRATASTVPRSIRGIAGYSILRGAATAPPGDADGACALTASRRCPIRRPSSARAAVATCAAGTPSHRTAAQRRGTSGRRRPQAASGGSARGTARAEPSGRRDGSASCAAFVETTREVLTGPRRSSGDAGHGRARLAAALRGGRGLDRPRGGGVLPGDLRSRSWARPGSPFGLDSGGVRPPAGLARGLGRPRGQVVFGGVFGGDRPLRRGRDPAPHAAAAGRRAPRLRGDLPRGVLLAGDDAAAAVLLFPSAAQLVGGVWCLVLYVIGLAEAHQIGHGKAAAAVLLPILRRCAAAARPGAHLRGAIASLVGQLRERGDAARGLGPRRRCGSCSRPGAAARRDLRGDRRCSPRPRSRLLHLDRLPLALCFFKALTGPARARPAARPARSGASSPSTSPGALAMNPLTALAALVARRLGAGRPRAPAAAPGARRRGAPRARPSLLRVAGGRPASLANWVYLVAAGR